MLIVKQVSMFVVFNLNSYRADRITFNVTQSERKHSRINFPTEMFEQLSRQCSKASHKHFKVSNV